MKQKTGIILMSISVLGLLCMTLVLLYSALAAPLAHHYAFFWGAATIALGALSVRRYLQDRKITAVPFLPLAVTTVCLITALILGK